MEMTSTARQALERLIVQNLIDGALAAGWFVPFVDDGGDELVKCTTAKDAMDAVFSVDDSVIQFVSPKMNKRYLVWIILGNGIDCVSDHSIGEDFQRDVMDKSNAFVEYLEAGGAAGLYAMECAKSVALVDALKRANTLLAELTFSEWIPKKDAPSTDIRQRINAAHVIASSAIAQATGITA